MNVWSSRASSSEILKESESSKVSIETKNEDKGCWRRHKRWFVCSRCCDCSGKQSNLIGFFQKLKFPKSACINFKCCPSFKCRWKRKEPENKANNAVKSSCGKCVSCCNVRHICDKFSRNKTKLYGKKEEKREHGKTKCKESLVKCCGYLCCINVSCCQTLKSRCGSNCCKRSDNIEDENAQESDQTRTTSIKKIKKRKWTRCFTDIPKLDVSFVEHGSIMRGSIPVLPVPLAWICLFMNVFLPGSGTLLSGMFCLCFGKPRYSINDTILARFGSFLINLLVAASQLFTVLFCLVGWGWSIWWGILMLRMARKNKRIMMAEQAADAANDVPVTVIQNHDVERAIPTG